MGLGFRNSILIRGSFDLALGLPLPKSKVTRFRSSTLLPLPLYMVPQFLALKGLIFKGFWAQRPHYIRLLGYFDAKGYIKAE